MSETSAAPQPPPPAPRVGGNWLILVGAFPAALALGAAGLILWSQLHPPAPQGPASRPPRLPAVPAPPAGG